VTNYATDVSPLIVDLETAPLLNVRDYLDPPDLTDIKAPSNYVKPDAIKEYIEREKVKRLADFTQDCDHKGALDFNTARIVACGWWTNGGDDQKYSICMNENHERAAISHFWQMSAQRLIVGFRIREFDLPMLIQRSRYLGIEHRTPDLGRYARGNGILDLYDLLTFNDLRGETIMRRSAASFARRFGIQVSDTVKGSEIPALVAAGEWEQVASHVRSDVQLTVALARKLGVLQSQPEPAAVL